MKKILISADPYDTRVAIIEDGTVVEVYIERADRRSMLGNIYLATVDTVLPGMEAAFIDAGLPKNGFLYVDEIVLPELDDKERRSRKIEQLIRSGQTLLVQVTKDPMGTKGARVTMDVSLAGRFLVFSPDGKGYGVSRRLPDEERERLRDVVRDLAPRNGGGVIVRTAARGATLDELRRDLDLLETQWEQIRDRAAATKPPALIHAEVDLALEMVRDDLRVEVDEVITDDEVTYQRIREYVEAHSPEFLPRIKLHEAATPLLRRYQVEDAIHSTLHRRVDLPSGGYLLFDYAEAFTIIDVNTGRFVGKSRLEDTILRNNLEAAREVVRQLRLRDIGGMVVIDFIDMASARNRDAVIACLQEELSKDRSKVYLNSISPLGLVEMTRQNVTDGVREILSMPCPHCHGEARVVADETIAIDNLRQLRRHARLSASEAFLVELHPKTAGLMIGAGGARLAQLEADTGRHFSLVGVDGVPPERCTVVREGSVADVLREALPVQEGQELTVEIAEPHMYQAPDAVAFLDGGYRIVIAGAGPYLGQKQPIRIDHVGRLEAHASLLGAKPVTEAEMLALIDRRTDILEPQRRALPDRIVLEERRGRRTRKTAATAAPRDAEAETEAETEEEPDLTPDADQKAASSPPAVTPATGPKRRRRRRGSGRTTADTKNATAATTSPARAARPVTSPAPPDGSAERPAAGSERSGASSAERMPAGSAERPTAGSPARRRGRRGGQRHRAQRERPLARASGETAPTSPAPAASEPPPATQPATPAAGHGAARTDKRGLIDRLLGR